MNNVKKQIADIENNINSGNCSQSDIIEYKKQIADLKLIIEWLIYQCSALYQAMYDNETKELIIKMKNTTRFHFKTISFVIQTKDDSKIPITVIDWKPDKTKSINFFHDFNNDEGYRTRKSLKLSIDVNSVEYEFYDDTAYFNTGNNDDKRYVKPNKYDKTQGYLVIIRNFCDTAKDYDLKAKARLLEDLLISIYDKVASKPELVTKVGKLNELYLPTICKSLDNYVDAQNKGLSGTNLEDIKSNAEDVLTTAVIATKKIKNDLYSGAVIDSTIDILAMKDMMKRDGLL